MGAMSPLSAVAAKRAGPRVVISGGLVLMSGGLLALSTAGVHSPYPPLAVFVAVMGAGMGLVMAPASEIIMETVPAAQAGAGSAVNDTVREVGGALGIAVVGSVVAASYAHSLSGVLALHHAPAQITRTATGSIAAADGIAGHIGGTVGGELASAAHAAFTSAMSSGMKVAAAVALVGALACLRTLPRRASVLSIGSDRTRDAGPYRSRLDVQRPEQLGRRVGPIAVEESEEEVPLLDAPFLGRAWSIDDLRTALATEVRGGRRLARPAGAVPASCSTSTSTPTA